MKSESEQWKLPVFIGSLLIVALLINTFFFRKAAAAKQAKEQKERASAALVLADKITKEDAEKIRKEKEANEKATAEAKAAKDKEDANAEARENAARQKAAEDAAAARASYLSRYLNTGFSRKPETATVAVAVASEEGRINPAVAATLVSRFQTNNIQILSSFFKPAFVADGLVADILSGRTDVFQKLELTNSLDALLLGRQVVEYSTNASLEKTVTANLRLELSALPVGATGESQSWNFAANGVGFRPHEARTLAEERIVEQIKKNTNMVLAPSLQQQ